MKYLQKILKQVQLLYYVVCLIFGILNINLDWIKQGGILLERVLNNTQTEYYEDYMKDTEYKLIENAIRGHKESFIAVIDSNKAYLYKTACLYMKNEHDASEVYIGWKEWEGSFSMVGKRNSWGC